MHAAEVRSVIFGLSLDMSAIQLGLPDKLGYNADLVTVGELFDRQLNPIGHRCTDSTLPCTSPFRSTFHRVAWRQLIKPVRT